MNTIGTEHEYDLAVIGAGSAGYAAGRTAASAGLRTALIEGGEEVGGLCILRGCMPTKALLYAAEVLHLAGHAAPWGIRAGHVGFDFAQVMARKNALIQNFADYRRQQLAGGKFKFLRARARFAGPHTLELSTGERLAAAHFVIATGSVVSAPPLPQLGQLGCLTSDTALELERLPESLIVLGGGAVAVEFAQFFARFGVRVTQIQRSAHLLRSFDEDAAGELEKAFRREGINLYTGTKLLEARRVGNEKEVAFEQNGQVVRVRAEQILLALGREPDITALGLEQIGVRVENRRIATNDRMQTSLPHIYAAGDCTGQHEIVHIAIQQGETAAHNLMHPSRMRTVDYRLLTEVVFTEPQVAVVGLTEKRARAANRPCLAASYPFNDHGKSIIMDAKEGFVKLLADPASGEIIGGCCVGPAGGELIHEIIAAMHKRMTVHELAAMPHYHPTLAEIWTYPAEELAAQVPATDCGALSATGSRPETRPRRG
ncbi:MAG TPA: dihydrolipoyl dehydrogenase [Verrucomicrobiota bacterium]|nr:dihydrolipoyl dehydrogenase [Verrucomicrobiota bacterium]HQL76788.1 dihydrolipoyl dehydrogenase [Verrucomicrobiota bacterium]